MECEYCKKQYSSVSSLNHHKKTNKKCLSMREINMNKLGCEYCNKQYTSVSNLNQHKRTNKKCLKIRETINRIVELEDIVRQKDEIIRQKDQDILDIAMKSHTTTNNITVNNNKYNFIQTTLNLSPESIKTKVDAKFTEEHFLDGQRGVAHFAYDFLLRDDDGKQNYHCTDVSRKIFVFKNKEGKIVKDCQSQFLTKSIVNDIIAKSQFIYNQVKSQLSIAN